MGEISRQNADSNADRPETASAPALAEDDLFADAPLPDRGRPVKRLAQIAGGIVIATIAVAAVAVPSLLIEERRAARTATLERQLSILASSRMAVIETWLQATAETTERIVGSELFRLFATEVDLAGGDISRILDAGKAPSDGLGGAAPLIDQLPFMERVLTDFVVGTDFMAGYLFGRDGVAYVASGGADTPGPAQTALAARVFDSGRMAFGGARPALEGLVMEIALPVFPAQVASEPADSPGDSPADRPGANVVGAMVFTLPVGARLAEILAPRPAAVPGERPRLLQLSGPELVELRPGESPPSVPLSRDDLLSAEGTISFARRKALEGPAWVYASGGAVPGTPWWVLMEIDSEAAEAELRRFTEAAALVSVLVVVAVVLAFGACWWWLTNGYNRALAEQFRDLAARIAAQKRLLDRINGSIGEHIGLKRLDGTYRYVNPAFATAVGRSVEEINGLDDTALFGQGTAERLALVDERALERGETVTSEEKVYLQSNLHYLQLSKAPFTDAEAEVAGIVTVARDVTDLVEAQARKDKAVQQTVSALVLAIELRDPYLAGHSRRVAGFATEIAKLCGATADQATTLEVAANLSQIGKLFVPQDLLTKPERLSHEERNEVREHIRHAESVLRDIDFGLPVLETIGQMHERIDGGGYPRRLAGDEILPTAQILGLCDWFCARVEPRGHRPSMTPEEALAILERNGERYAPALVAKLRQAAGSVVGEKLVAAISPH